MYSRSNARSTWVVASTLSIRRTRSFSRASSPCSAGVSTRTIPPRVPLPYCRTQRCTVPSPLIPCRRCTAAKVSPPSSTSRTTVNLKASPYRISGLFLLKFDFMAVNL